MEARVALQIPRLAQFFDLLTGMLGVTVVVKKRPIVKVNAVEGQDRDDLYVAAGVGATRNTVLDPLALIHNFGREVIGGQVGAIAP